MQTMHTIHIRGPQPMFFLFRENQSIPLFTQLRFYFFKSTFMFFSRKEKNNGEKNCHSPHPESTFFNMQILHVYEIITGFSQLYFYRYDCFFAAQDGFVKKCIERERGVCGVQKQEVKRER